MHRSRFFRCRLCLSMTPFWNTMALLLLLTLAVSPGPAGCFSFFGNSKKETDDSPMSSEEDLKRFEEMSDSPWDENPGFFPDYDVGQDIKNLYGFGGLTGDHDRSMDMSEPQDTFEETFKEVFRLYDLDENEQLDLYELRRALLHSRATVVDAMGEDLVEAAMTRDDRNKDGALSLDEFLLARNSSSSGINELGSIEL